MSGTSRWSTPGTSSCTSDTSLSRIPAVLRVGPVGQPERARCHGGGDNERFDRHLGSPLSDDRPAVPQRVMEREERLHGAYRSGRDYPSAPVSRESCSAIPVAITRSFSRISDGISASAARSESVAHAASIRCATPCHMATGPGVGGPESGTRKTLSSYHFLFPVSCPLSPAWSPASGRVNHFAHRVEESGGLVHRLERNLVRVALEHAREQPLLRSRACAAPSPRSCRASRS